MATIDNLNFGVILDDKAFLDNIQRDINKAKELNTTLSGALTNKLPAGSTGLRNFNTHLSRSNNLMRTLGQLTGVAFSVVGIRRFLSTLIDVTGQFEVQKMALRNMLQDIDAADKIFQDLYNFSSESTYRFSELAKYAKQLAAFNIDKNNLLETTKMLGDVASGVGVSMDRLILAYGHVKSSGFLRGIQLRSFSQNGVPILEELSKMFTEIEGKAVSLGDVFDKMMKREIGFDMVEEAFRRMTSEGGKFYQMQEVLAKTLSGQINILKGKWENLMYAIGESQEGILKGAVGALTKIVSSAESFGRTVKFAVSILGAYKIATLVAAAATDTLTAAQARQVAVVGNLVGKILNLATNPYTYLALAIAGVTAAVIKEATAFDKINKIHDAAAKSIQNFANRQSEEIAELTRLVERLKLAEEGTQEYAAAKNELENRFGPYLQQLRNEGKEVDNLATLYDNLATKIENANRERFRDEAMEGIGAAYGDAVNQIDKALQNSITQGGVTSIAVQEAIRGYVRGYVTKESAIAAGVPESMFSSVTYNGPYSMGSYNTAEGLDYIKGKYEQAGREMQAAKDEVADALNIIFGPENNGTGESEGSQTVIKIQSVIDGIKKIDAELATLRNKAKSSGGITEDEQKRIEALTEDREEQAKLYKSIMGADYDKSVKAAQTEQNKATKDRISNLKAEAAVLEKYLDAREKLEPFFGGDTDNQLAKIFGDSRDYSALEADIATLCDRLRELGTEGAEAAEQIETRLGLDKTSSILKAQKALQKWQATLRKWTKDWGGGDYHGIEGDIDKVIRDYNNEDDEITQDYIDSLNEIMEAHWGDADAINAEIAALDKLVAARRAANATQQQEKLNDLASKYVKDKTHNLNLRDWGDKSIGQVRDIYRALTELAKGEVVLDETMTGRLQRAGLAIEDFSKLAKEEFEQLSENAKQELIKKFCNTLKEVVSELNAVAGAVKDFADAAGNNGLSVAMEGLSFTMDSLGKFAEKAATGDWIGAIVGYAASLATAFFQAQAEVARFEATLRAARETARMENMLGGLGADSIFGESGIRKIRDAVSVIRQARASINAAAMPSTFNRKHTFWDELGMSGRRLSYTLAELAESVGRDLYDAYGNLNADTLKAILETYDDLGQAEQEWINRAINDSEAYAKSMEQMEGVLQDVIGNMASQATDKIVDSWIAAGDAALDYADILDDVARSYAKMITQSMLIDSVLTPEFKNQLLTLFKNEDTEGAMALILGGMEQMQAMAPEIAAALDPLRPYIQTDGSGTDPLKDGINKELVEGNSSLIASYMNAMRADLSVVRGLQSIGWQDVRLIREYAPTYADYMARIEANTFDNAQAAQSILARLQSIITPSTNGGSAVRTTR